MQRIMLRAKLHRVTVTEADLHYEGPAASTRTCWTLPACASSSASRLYNVTNGERFDTYIIKAARGSARSR